MKPFMKTALAVGTVGVLAFAAITPSMARNRAWPAVGAGFVAGAIVGSAVANANAGYYDDSYAYAPGPTYVTPGYDAYGYAPAPSYDTYGYAPRTRYYNNGPNREDQLTGTGIGANW